MLYLLSIGALCFALFACGSSEKPATQQENTQEAADNAAAATDSSTIKIEKNTQEIDEHTESLKKALDDL